MEIDVSKLHKARRIFERFRHNMQDEQDEAGAVQAFEFCYELAWKMMKRVLQYRGLQVASPKEVFRKAALDNLIDDPEIWFEFQKKRNLTSHTYEQDNVTAILATFDLFSKELEQLIQRLEAVE